MTDTVPTPVDVGRSVEPGHQPGGFSAATVLARTCLVVAGTVLGLLVADFALGFAQPPRMSGKRQLLPLGQPFGFHCYPTNPHGEFIPAPIPGERWRLFEITVPPVVLPLSRLVETPWCVRYAISKQGLRGAVVPAVAATGTVRVLGLGDSFAIGEGVAEKDSVFAQLDRRLGPKVEILNAGRSGYDTARELALLRRMLPATSAHRSLVIFLLNDIAMPRALRARQRWINDLVNVRERQLWQGKDRPWWHRSRLLRATSAWWRMRSITAATVQWYQDAWDPAINPHGLRKFRADLQAMTAVPGNRMALVIYPMLLRLDDYPFADIHARVVAIARELKVPVLDLTATFASLAAADLHVHAVDHHPNATAHGHAAAAIGDWLKSLPGYLAADLPALPRAP